MDSPPMVILTSRLRLRLADSPPTLFLMSETPYTVSVTKPGFRAFDTFVPMFLQKHLENREKLKVLNLRPYAVNARTKLITKSKHYVTSNPVVKKGSVLKLPVFSLI